MPQSQFSALHLQSRHQINNMTRILCFLAVSSTLFLGSCVDIFDELFLKEDGTGTYKYNINLSYSKVKINSILALDSLDGRRIPELQEIKDKVVYYQEKLRGKEGIKNVTIDANYTDFVFKLTVDFESVNQFQTAIRELIKEEIADKENSLLKENWISWNGSELVRSIPNFQTPVNKLKKEDQESLKSGKYMSVTRFEKAIDKCDNPQAQISPSKTAVMVKATPYAVSINPGLLKNTIQLID